MGKSALFSLATVWFLGLGACGVVDSEEPGFLLENPVDTKNDSMKGKTIKPIVLEHVYLDGMERKGTTEVTSTTNDVATVRSDRILLRPGKDGEIEVSVDTPGIWDTFNADLRFYLGYRFVGFSSDEYEVFSINAANHPRVGATNNSEKRKINYFKSIKILPRENRAVYSSPEEMGTVEREAEVVITPGAEMEWAVFVFPVTTWWTDLEGSYGYVVYGSCNGGPCVPPN